MRWAETCSAPFSTGTRHFNINWNFSQPCCQGALGVTIGLVAGYFGGRLDSFLMRVADIQLSFTTLMVAIVILAVFQATVGLRYYEDFAILAIILVIGVSEWPQYARTVRACVLLREKAGICGCCPASSGLPPRTIIFRHILPNTFSPLLVILYSSSRECDHYGSSTVISRTWHAHYKTLIRFSHPKWI